MLNIIDEYTRECLAISVGRKITANDVIDTLADLFLQTEVCQLTSEVTTDQNLWLIY